MAMNDRKKMTIRTALNIAGSYTDKGKGGIIQAAETLRTAYLSLLKKKRAPKNIAPRIPKGWEGIDFKKLKS